MPITDKSTAEPLLRPLRIGHGTMECQDLAKTRRFYEEVLGIECAQTSTISMVIRLGTPHTYVVVQTGNIKPDGGMAIVNHNGLDVASVEDVDSAFAKINAIKDEWGLRKVMPAKNNHGDYSFYFVDFDGNWWEVIAGKDGYTPDFEDVGRDITGLHEFDDEKPTFHTHTAEARERVRAVKAKRA